METWISTVFAQKLSEKHSTTSIFDFKDVKKDFEYVVEEGRKFDKIVNNEEGNRHVHAFIEKETGRLVKPDSWTRPAKWGNDLASKYVLQSLEDINKVVAESDYRGSYLYK
jgi:hypothetical protein